MSLTDDVAAVLPVLRAEAESLMIDTVTVDRQSGEETHFQTGAVTQTYTDVYSGAAKVQATISQSRVAAAGEHQYTVQEYRVDIPVSAGPLQVGDRVTVTASVLDPFLAGRVYRVVELFHKSFATAQRARVEEVTS
jgi:hypothetical protein